MYDVTDGFAYEITDEVNDIYLKMLDSFTSDSFAMFKAAVEGSMTAIVYLNEDGTIKIDSNVVYLEDYRPSIRNSVVQFMHRCIV